MEKLTPEEFKKQKFLEEKILDNEDEFCYNSLDETDPQDWCPEHW